MNFPLSKDCAIFANLCKINIGLISAKISQKIATSRCGGGLAKMQRCHFLLGYISTIYRQTGRPNLCSAIASFFKSLLRLCAIFATSLQYLCYSIDNASTKEDKNFMKKHNMLGLKNGRFFEIFMYLWLVFMQLS